MKKHKQLFPLLLLMLGITAVLSACSGGGRDLTGMVKVVYELEGGIYQNCDRAVTQYYERGDGAVLATDPETLSKRQITRSGYTLEGWYREKAVSGENVTYSGKWSFKTDKVPEDGLTLYARWVRDIRYTYEVCYLDDDGNTVVLDSYDTDAGKPFNSYYAALFGKLRTGYTALDGVYDKDGNEWDASFTHPGGDKDTAVQVYLHFIKGTYKLVRNANELLSAKTQNIYLVNDIDFEGGSFSGFESYRGTIEGNGHVIKNFRLSYDNTKSGLVSDPDLSDEGGLLRIGIFRELSGATLRNVSFTDFTIDVNVGYPATKTIIIAPLAVKAANTVLENVSVSGSCTVTKLPDRLDRESLRISEGAIYYLPEGDSTDTSSVTVTFTVADSAAK